MPKQGNRPLGQPKSYRPISLISFLLNTAVRLVVLHIRCSLQNTYPLHPKQFAYQRKGKMTKGIFLVAYVNGYIYINIKLLNSLRLFSSSVIVVTRMSSGCSGCIQSLGSFAYQCGSLHQTSHAANCFGEITVEATSAGLSSGCTQFHSIPSREI